MGIDNGRFIAYDPLPTLTKREPALPRPRSPYLRADYKLSLPAALVAEVDLLLEDPLTKRPRYGAKSKLVEALLRSWLAGMRGTTSTFPIPSLEELNA